MNIPNTILIGAQKAGTSSFYDWLSQHPDIFAPKSVKDYPYFSYEDYYSKGLKHYKKYFEKKQDESIILAGSVNYVCFEYAIKRIHELNKDMKLIFVLRNPIERAFSAYNYQLKMMRENITDFETALEQENERLCSDDFTVLSELTYIEHGLYYKQLQMLQKYFPLNQIKVILFDDIKENPELTVKEVFTFLNIDREFKPEFNFLNETGEIKYKWIKSLLYKQGSFRKFIVQNIVNVFLPLEKRAAIKDYISHQFTIKSKKNNLEDHIKEKLLSEFIVDINSLEILLNKDLSLWKKI